MSLPLIGVWKEIFSKKRYLVLTLLIGLAFYLLNVLIVQWKNLSLISSVGIWNVLFLGFYTSVYRITFYNTIIIGILIGILISLLIYRYTNIKKSDSKKYGAVSSIGIFLGLFASGCVACGVGLAPLLGLSAALALLPFQGAEISFIAIVLLAFSIYRVSMSFVKCDVQSFFAVSTSKFR